MLPGIVLEGLFGRHTGPRLRPLVPVRTTCLHAVSDAGFRFVQFGPLTRTTPRACRDAGLQSVASLTWHFAPRDGDLGRALGRCADAGYDRASILVGSGLTGRSESIDRVGVLLESAKSAGVDMLLETHRATLTESIEQTLALATAFPALRFNLDLSHWFVTHRLDRSSPDAFIDAAAVVLARCGLVHGRVASPSEIQVPVDGAAFAAFFARVWAEVAARSPDAWFAPELLPAWMGYARDGGGDRWADAAALCRWVSDA